MATPTEPNERSSRLRLAELTSGVGALVLGIGVGALLADRVAGLALPLLFAGALIHGWGMFDKHRLERASGAVEVWWERVLYWICWALLAFAALGLAARLANWF